MRGQSLTSEELRTLLALAKRALWGPHDVREKLQDQGLNIVPASFYSTIPSLKELAAGFEYTADAAGPYDDGKLFLRTRIEEFTGSLVDYASEFDPPIDVAPAGNDAFYWQNPAFSRLDAMAYYCTLRHFRPKRVLEVGAGFSTLVADEALRKNGSGEIIIIEPYPKPLLTGLASVSRIIERPVQSIPAPEMIRLVEDCDVWFIDSTHTVKAGSDCLYLYLKVMPYLESPVLCHSHDIFLPYGMPQRWIRDLHIYWTEQYLLQAYLLDNPKAQVLFGSNYVHRHLPELATRMMSGRFESGGSSLWYALNNPGSGASDRA